MNRIALALGRYRLHFVARGPVHLPAFSGSMWRGAFGHALKRLVCVTREKECTACPLWRGCAYPYLFATPPRSDAGLLGKVGHAPLPLVFHVELGSDCTLLQGERITLDINLFGHGNRYVSYLVHALERAAQQGVGRGRGSLQLSAVEQADGAAWQTIYQPGSALTPLPVAAAAVPALPERVRCVLETPLRLRINNHYIGPAEFRAEYLLVHVLRRASQIVAHHSDVPFDADFRALKTLAQAVEPIERDLRWLELSRWSQRQQEALQIGGLLGQMSFAGEAIETFWPLLWLGQWLHAGKNASMGQGRYRLEAA